MDIRYRVDDVLAEQMAGHFGEIEWQGPDPVERAESRAPSKVVAWPFKGFTVRIDDEGCR